MEIKQIDVPNSQILESKLHDILSPSGFECYPFKIEWYNKQVDKPFALPYSDDTLAFLIVSTPDVFEKAFKPFISRLDCERIVRDPIDECMIDQFNVIKQVWPDDQVEIIHDFEMTYSRRPKILVQTAGHVSGAAYYYRKSDLKEGTWSEKQKIFGVSVHPKYGGWFAFRGIVIFKSVECPSLEQKLPVDCVPTQELRKELLEQFNYHWQDWKFRDIVPAAKQYSEEQKTYFKCLPKDRKNLVEEMKANRDKTKSV